MATPVGHSIVGYVMARAAGVESPLGLAAAVGAASLPDVDMALGYLAAGDPFSLHHEIITHEPAFAVLAGVATGLAVRLRGRSRRPGEALRAGLLATGLVGAHIVMDLLPVPYDTMPLRRSSRLQGSLTHAWNAVIDLAVYGGLALLVLSRGAPAARTTGSRPG